MFVNFLFFKNRDLSNVNSRLSNGNKNLWSNSIVFYTPFKNLVHKYVSIFYMKMPLFMTGILVCFLDDNSDNIGT